MRQCFADGGLTGLVLGVAAAMAWDEGKLTYEPSPKTAIGVLPWFEQDSLGVAVLGCY